MAATMEDNTGLLEELLDKVLEYGKTELELAKLKAIDKASDIVSASVPSLIVIVTASVFLLFLNLGVAIWVGGLLDNLFLGFFAVSAFYGVLVLILLLIRKWLKRKVGDSIIKRVLN